MRISDWSSDVCSSDLSVTYIITDGDGDTATATLTITINGADDGVTIEGLDADGAELSVDEDDLPARAGEAPGDRQSVVSGKSVSVRVDLGGPRLHKKKKTPHTSPTTTPHHPNP